MDAEVYLSLSKDLSCSQFSQAETTEPSLESTGGVRKTPVRAPEWLPLVWHEDSMSKCGWTTLVIVNVAELPQWL